MRINRKSPTHQHIMSLLITFFVCLGINAFFQFVTPEFSLDTEKAITLSVFLCVCNFFLSLVDAEK